MRAGWAERSTKGYAHKGQARRVRVYHVDGAMRTSPGRLLQRWSARPYIHRDQVRQILSGQGIVATETEKRLVAPGDITTRHARHRSITQPGPSDGQVEKRTGWLGTTHTRLRGAD